MRRHDKRSDGLYDAVLSLSSWMIVQTTTNLQLRHAGTISLESYPIKVP